MNPHRLFRIFTLAAGSLFVCAFLLAQGVSGIAVSRVGAGISLPSPVLTRGRASGPAASAGSRLAMGALTVTGSSGQTPAGNAFSPETTVYLSGGSFGATCSMGALADGNYVYQVTDVSGNDLLSADGAANRTFTVLGGIIATAPGSHAVAISTGTCGSKLVDLGPFNHAPQGQGVYKVWVTPAANLQTANCAESTGCYFGFLPQYSETINFAVAEGPRCLNTECVSGTVFADLNQNSIRDAGEPGIPGLEVEATDSHGITATATTDQNGNYQICGLTDQQYTLTVVVPTGYQQTYPAGARQLARYLKYVNGGYLFTICAGGFQNLNFGLFPEPGSICGEVFNDMNGNGLLDPGEPGVQGVTVSLTASGSSTPVATATTDSNGDYCFDSITPGNYVVTATVPAGFTQTDPSNNGTIGVALQPGQTSNNNNFGIAILDNASISGTKFDDVNGNGQQDPGEGGISGVTINLAPSAGGSSQSVVTDTNGNFRFDSLAPGSYVLSEVVPSNYHQTYPGGNGTQTVTVTVGQTVSGILFGNQLNSGTISGLVFYDLNKDGVQDDGEKGFANVTVNLKDGSGNIVMTTTTDANGNFTFPNVVPGNYNVQPIPPTNFWQTVPISNAPIQVTVAPGGTVTGLIFGETC